MALDQATSDLLAEFAKSGAKPLEEMTPLEARGFAAMLAEMGAPGPDVASVEDTVVSTDTGDVPVRVIKPTDPRSVIVYYHGGGWVIGALPEFDALGRHVANNASATVVLVDYRLAPEHRYPTAVEDSWAALQWVNDHLGELAGEGAPVIVMGDSAGGNLSAVMAQRAHRAGIDLAMQVLIYPVTDSDVESPTYSDVQNQLLLTRASMVWFWDHYLPDASRRREPDASPLRADDLSGLAPAVVLTAEHDVLRHEGEAYAEKLRAAGVPVEHRRFAGQMHGFFTMVGVLPGASEGMAFAVDQITRQREAATAR